MGTGNTNNIGDGSGEMGDNLNDIDLGSSFTAVSIDCLSYSTCALSSDAGYFSLFQNLCLSSDHVVSALHFFVQN